MSLLAMIGLLLGALAASAWVVAVDRLPPDIAANRRPVSSQKNALAQPDEYGRPPDQPPRQATVAAIEKPQIARLQETDVMRTLGGILKVGGIPDLTRMGWPTLRAGSPLMSFPSAMRDMRATVARRSVRRRDAGDRRHRPGRRHDRSIAALNVALAAAHDGARVLMIDADHAVTRFRTRSAASARARPRASAGSASAARAARAVKTGTAYRSCLRSRARTPRRPTRSARPSRRRAPPAATIS